MNEDFVFTPVVITRGRKFKGHAYYLGDDSQFSPAYGVTCWSTKLWDPAQKKYVWANPDFCDDDLSVTKEQIERDRAVYTDKTIDDTLEYCRKTGGEVEQHARAIMLKRYPEMRARVDERLPDRRDVVTEVERTLAWASGLKSRPAVIYGKRCEGGKPYGDAKKLRIAFRSLDKRGLTALEGFKETWDLLTGNMNMKTPKDIRFAVDHLGENAVPPAEPDPFENV